MEVRCGSCKKLFRVSDDKITGSGIKFKCSRCAEYVKITIEEFNLYQLAKSATPRNTDRTESGTVPPDADTNEIKKREPASPAPPLDLKGTEAPERAVPAFEKDRVPVTPDKAEIPTSPDARREPVHAASAAEPVQAAPAPVQAHRQSARPVSQIGVVSSDFLKPKQADISGTVHPLASGATAGTIGGIGAALPAIIIVLLGVNSVSSFISKQAAQTSSVDLVATVYSMATIAASMTGLGIVIGIVLAMIQAGTGRKIFSFGGILIGLFLGTAIGAGKGLIVSAGTGGYISLAVVIPEMIGWAAKSILISIIIVLVRRLMMSSNKESFSAHISGVQVIGLLLSLIIIGFAGFSEVQSGTAMRTATTGVVDTFKNVTSTEGLQITNNPAGYIDSNGDLVITGAVENKTDNEKPIWFLVASVFDAQGTVIVEAKMLSGKQLYTSRDYDILAKRGVDVQELKVRHTQEKGTPLPPHGLANFEIRIMEPPIGIATFNTLLQQFDPLLMVKEAAEEIKQNQQ